MAGFGAVGQNAFAAPQRSALSPKQTSSPPLSFDLGQSENPKFSIHIEVAHRAFWFVSEE